MDYDAAVENGRKEPASKRQIQLEVRFKLRLSTSKKLTNGGNVTSIKMDISLNGLFQVGELYTCFFDTC